MIKWFKGLFAKEVLEVNPDCTHDMVDEAYCKKGWKEPQPGDRRVAVEGLTEEEILEKLVVARQKLVEEQVGDAPMYMVSATSSGLVYSSVAASKFFKQIAEEKVTHDDN